MLDLLFGYTVIIACGVSKVPQVRSVLTTRVTRGLSVTSIVMELYCHCLNTGFFIFESYPVLNFLEYPLIIIQNFILIFVIGQVNQQVFKHFLIILSFITFTSTIAVGVFPKYILVAALSMNSIIGVSSKITQINAIRTAQNSDSVSYFFYSINIMTSTLRVYTNMVRPSWEPMVVVNLLTNMVANCVVIFTISNYRTGVAKIKKDE